MEQIQLIARFQIHDGHLDPFQLAAETCIAIVREKDIGTIQYDWFFSTDGTECVVQELYVDSDAVLVHIANVSETLSGMLKIADVILELYGEPSPALREAIEAMPHQFYRYSRGL